MTKIISVINASLYSLEIFEMFYLSFFSGVRGLTTLASRIPFPWKVKLLLFRLILKLSMRRQRNYSPKNNFLPRPHLQAGKIGDREGMDGVRNLGYVCISQHKYLVLFTLYLLTSSLINKHWPFFNLNESQQVLNRVRITRTNYYLDSIGKLMDYACKRLVDTEALKNVRRKNPGENVGQAQWTFICRDASQPSYEQRRKLITKGFAQ